MAQLTCGAQACSYNQDNCCCKGDIMVGAEQGTCCESFHKRNENAFISSSCRPSPTVSIDCDAVRCIYNTDYRCRAEKVAIKGSSAASSMETVCATFQEK